MVVFGAAVVVLDIIAGLGKPVEVKYKEPRGIPPIDDMVGSTT